MSILEEEAGEAEKLSNVLDILTLKYQRSQVGISSRYLEMCM